MKRSVVRAKMMIGKHHAAQGGVFVQNPDAIRAQTDFPFFCEYLTRNSPEPKVQAEHMQLWNKVLLTGKDSAALLGIAGMNTDILSPRGSAKTTYLGMFLSFVIGQHTMNKRLLQILYISYTVEVARPKSAAIRQIIESAEYREIFPMVIKGPKWGDEHWTIDYSYAGIPTLGQDVFTMCCAGLKGAIVSKRSHLIVLDDIIKSQNDIAKREIREQMSMNWTRSIAPTMFDGGRAICLGTRFRADDIHQTTFKSTRWIQIEQSAIIRDPITRKEKTYWDFWSLDYLRGLREEDPEGFSFQYQNKIVRSLQTVIDPKWFVRGPVMKDAWEYDSLVIAIDLASSTKEKSDYTVMTMIGRHRNMYHVLDGRRGRWTGNIEKLDVLLDLWEGWGYPDCRVAAEAVAYQTSFSGDFRQYVIGTQKIEGLSCTGVSIKGDKMQRLRGVSGMFERGLVVFNEEADLEPWLEEFSDFGQSSHDDCVDSTVIGLNAIAARVKLEVA
jgi:predicted phage terminase large subunit-like protein